MKNRPLTHQPMHVIYRLYGSMPVSKLLQIRKCYEADLLRLALRYPPTSIKTEQTNLRYNLEKSQLAEKFQLSYDQLLEQISEGPHYLKHPDIQKIIIDSWCTMEQMGWVNVYAVSVMPNHVHALISHPKEKGEAPLFALLEKHKRFTGRRINKHLGKKGRRVWAAQAFDRDVRRNKFGTVFWYILDNPVKARLCKVYNEWQGNYWHPDFV